MIRRRFRNDAGEEGSSDLSIVRVGAVALLGNYRFVWAKSPRKNTSRLGDRDHGSRLTR